MIATAPGQRALHALRLVLSQPKAAPPSQSIRRSFSVAVLPNYPQQPSLASSAPSRAEWGPRHASSDYEGGSDFLEEPSSSSEYTSASLALPPRTSSATAHWATLFSDPSYSSVPTTPRQRRCDTLARLVSEGDLQTARTVYDELSALHIGILRRTIYLPAALSSLDQTPAGKQAFLFWLELVPNRPAVRPHPAIKALWRPIVTSLIDNHSSDLPFISDFLTLMARKGVLPSVIGPIVRHLALFTSPAELEGWMNKLVKVYMDSTTSMHSTSRRARAHEAFARKRVTEMWESLVRALAAAGWEEELGTMVQRMEGKVDLSEYTKLYIAEREGKAPVHQKTKPSDTGIAGDVEQPDPPSINSGIAPRIMRRIRRARNGAVRPSEMAEIVDVLEQHDRTNLVRLLGRRLERAYETKREMWYHAAILLARKRGWSDGAVVAIYNQHFHWVGLPASVFGMGVGNSGDNVHGNFFGSVQATDIPIKPMDSAPSTTIPQAVTHRSKLYPSPSLLTSLLPCLLPLLGSSSSTIAFHNAYLALLPSLSPRLRPTHITHSVLLREITHLHGPSAGLLALRNMLSAGIEPGLNAYHAVLWSLAGRGEFGDCRRLLSAMEKGSVPAASQWGVQAARMPKPTEETYKGIAGILERRGKKDEAEMIRERLRKQGYGERNTTGSRERVTREERRLGVVYGKKARELVEQGRPMDMGEEEWEEQKLAMYG